MFEELLEVATGRWGLLALAVVLLPGGRKFIRTAAKEVIRAGIVVTDKAKDMVAEIKEEASDVVAEVRAERGENKIKHDSHTKHTAKA